MKRKPRELNVVESQEPRKVTVAVKMMNTTGRQRLRGVYRYIAEGRDWDVRLLRAEAELTVQSIRQAEKDGTQGFLVCYHPERDTLAALSMARAPVVSFVVGAAASRRGFLRLPDEDNKRIGALAAEHFLSLGRFRSFGFVPDEDELFWSRQRLDGFRRRLGREARNLSVYRREAHGTSSSDAQSLAEWLVNLPKPAAVMAAWDYRAAQVISACRHIGIAVPMQVAVCGMDNDEFICDSTNPRLTSIRADRDGQGYAAAAALDALIDGRVPRIDHAPFRAATIVVRASSAPLAPAASLVERALAFANENALSGIDAADVARHLGVSRRLLDLRFKQLGIPSISSTLTNRRLAEAKRLLSTTSFPIDRIASLSGFRNPDSLRNLFRRRFGVSMRACRGISVMRQLNAW